MTDAKLHPNFEFDTNDNDYALVLLEKPYNMDSDIQLVLNENTNFPWNNEMLEALGMGNTKKNGPVTVKLRNVKVTVMTNKECQKYYGSDVKNNMLCAGYKEGKKNICYGDSGGPLVKVDGNKHIQVGISSFVGGKCAGKIVPVGTLVSAKKSIGCKALFVIHGKLNRVCADHHYQLHPQHHHQHDLQHHHQHNPQHHRQHNLQYHHQHDPQHQHQRIPMIFPRLLRLHFCPQVTVVMYLVTLR